MNVNSLNMKFVKQILIITIAVCSLIPEQGFSQGKLPETWTKDMKLVFSESGGIWSHSSEVKISEKGYLHTNQVGDVVNTDINFTKKELNDLLSFLKKKNIQKLKPNFDPNYECPGDDCVTSTILITWGGNKISVAEKTRADVEFFFTTRQYISNLLESKKVVIIPEEAFTIVEQMPQFPGGEEQLKKYIKERLILPQKVKERKISGTCFVAFTVEKNGELTGLKIIKGITNCEECDQEAIRVVNSMSKWIPGKQNGREVRVWFNMPIKFGSGAN